MAGKSFFVSVELAGKDGKKISDALYPIGISKSGNLDEYNDLFVGMNPLPVAALKVQAGSVHESGPSTRTVPIEISNPTNRIAYFVRIRLAEESATLVSSYSDNYISMLPGETKRVDVSVEGKDAPSSWGNLTFDVSGWNCPNSAVTITP
jgi:hypothetical protein